MLDIHQLNIFLAAAETLSFTQAAQRLHMTQPSISQHIQSLERHFGCDLFARNGRTLELTDAGLALKPLARDAVNLSVRIDETLASLKGEVVGHLMVGCSTTPGKYVLPQLLARFHNRFPQVRVTCQVSSQQQAMQSLNEGGVHFALTSLSHEYSPELEFYKFMSDQVVLIVPLDHPWAQRGTIKPAELAQAQLILREETSGTYVAVRDALGGAGIAIKDLRVMLTLGNSEAIAMAVEEGLGVGFVSQMVVDRLSQGRLVQVILSEINIHRDIYFIRNVRHTATVAQNAFWDFVLSKDNPIFCQEDRLPVHEA